MENNVVVAASIFGKLKTIFQMVLICLILLVAHPNEQLPLIIMILAYLTTLISFASGVDYFYKNIKFLKK